jgi:hypothetical protein
MAAIKMIFLTLLFLDSDPLNQNHTVHHPLKNNHLRRSSGSTPVTSLWCELGRGLWAVGNGQG